MTLMQKAADKVREEGFTVTERLTDDDGTIGYEVEKDGDTYMLVAKEYSYKGLASFMRDVVREADSRGADLIFYADSDGRLTVFDTTYVQRHGNLSEGESKQKPTIWKEISRSHGVDLGEYLDGETPDRLSGDNTSLADFA